MTLLAAIDPRGYKTARQPNRSVAQSGSAPRSGRGGRRFKSCHSDQISPSREDADEEPPRRNGRERNKQSLRKLPQLSYGLNLRGFPRR